MHNIIVIGSNVSSLVAACLAVHRGEETLLLEDSRVSHALSFSGGYIFDADPLPWTGLDHAGVFRKFLFDMKIECPFVDEVAPPIQVILDDRRVDLPSGIAERCHEISRDYLVRREDIQKYYERIVEDSLFIRDMVPKCLGTHGDILERALVLFHEMKGRALRRARGLNHAAALNGCPDLKRTLAAEYALFSRYDQSGFDSEFSSYGLFSSLQGSYQLPFGGKEAIIAAVKRKFIEDGGEILSCDDIKALHCEDGIAVDVLQAGTRSKLSGRRCIISTRWRELPSLLQNNKHRVRHRRNRFPSSGTGRHLFTIHLGVDERSLPEQVGEHVIILTEDSKSPVPMLPFLYLNRISSGRRGRAPAGKCALSLTVILSETPRNVEDEILINLASFMLELLGWCFPFLPGGIDSLDLERSIHLSRQAAEDGGPDFSLKRRFLAGLPLHNGKTPRKNLFLAGGELAPLLGFDGDIISGINAARAALGESNYVYYPFSG